MAKLQVGSPEKQYGDQKALDQFRQTTKTLPISGAPVQKRGPGRPQVRSEEPAAQVPQEHVALFQRLAQAEQTAAYWTAMAQQSPSPLTQLYAKRAQLVRDTLAQEVYKSTPNFIV